jgi:pimeloyl-ACP methyl ester carboxylesterase
LDRIRVNGVELEYLDEGTGVPVVFSHGGASDVRYWQPQRKAFAQRYRFIAYSRRFHGAGRWAMDGDDSADAHATDLLTIIRQLGVGTAHVVGFSTAIALRAALREPELIRSLAVIEPNVPWLLEGDDEGEAVLEYWQRANDRLQAEAGEDGERLAELWFELVNHQGRGTFAAQPHAFREMWIENMTRPRPVASPPSPLAWEQLRALGAPTLVVGAEHGMPYSRLIVERLASCIPNCRRVVVPAVTHFMSYQAPGRFNDLILDFLAEN